MSFLPTSLERLVESLSHNDLPTINQKFPHFMTHFRDLTDEKKLLLTQKGVYPYDYMDSFEKFNEKTFPCLEECYNKLNDEALSEEDYSRAIQVWNTFNIQTMGEYHDLYLKTDVLLLADVFENF